MKKILSILALSTITATATAAPKAYVIGETEVLDATKLEPYRQQMVKTLDAYNGRFIVRGSTPEVTEGEASKGRMAIIEFDSLEKAKAWYNSPEYSALRPIRQGSTNSRVMFVEGILAQ